MSQRLKRHKDVLNIMSKAKSGTNRDIINQASPDLINCFSEICMNTLKGRVNMSKKQLQKLRRYKKQVRDLASKSKPIKNKKKSLQKGGFIAALLAPLIGSILKPLLLGQ